MYSPGARFESLRLSLHQASEGGGGGKQECIRDAALPSRVVTAPWLAEDAQVPDSLGWQ